jgi:hypothetical protein
MVDLKEFEYFNNKHQIIPKEELEKIHKKVDEEEHYIYYNDILKKNNKIFIFNKNEITVHSVSNIDRLSDKTKILVQFNRICLLNFDYDRTKLIHILNEISISQSYIYENIYEILLSRDGNTVKSTYIDTIGEDHTGATRINDFLDALGLPQCNFIRTNINDDDFYYIHYVYEFRVNKINYRLYIVSNDKYYRILVVSDKNYNLYVNIDKGKVYISSWNYTSFFDTTLFKINQKNILEVDNDALHIIDNKRDKISNDRVITIGAELYNFYKTNRQSQISGQYLKDKITMKYFELLTNGKELKIKNFLISKNKIEIPGEFVLEFDKTFLNTPDKIGELRELIERINTSYNLNEFWEELLKISIVGYIELYVGRDRRGENFNIFNNFTETTFTLNGMVLNIKKPESGRIHINNMFCRFADVHHLIEHLICYTNINEYNQYIKDIEKIGVNWKKLINTGVNLKIVNSINDFYRYYNVDDDNDIVNHYDIRLSLYWDANKRNQVYIMINNNKHLITNKRLFMKHFYSPYTTTNITKLSETLYGCLGQSDVNIYNLVDDAIVEFQVVKERAERLVADTLTNTNTVKTKITILNNEITGYYLKGIKSQSEYFIEAGNLAVYKKMDGNWNKRCVVDRHDKNRIYEDRLANRIVNIYNEPARIHTIQQ